MPLSPQQNAKFAFQDWYAFPLTADYEPQTISAGMHTSPIVNSSLTDVNITGLVVLDTTPLDNKVVRLYHKATGRLLDETTSNELGEYTFKHNINDRHKYYVIAFDDMDNPVYQALALDDLTAQIL